MVRPTLGMLLTAALMNAAGKIIAALGIGIITYSGLQAVQQYFINHILNTWNGLPADAVQILLIGGAGVALNWIFGAIAFQVAHRSLSKLGVVMKGK